ILAGNDGSPGNVGSLRSRDDGGKGIQRGLDGGSVPAFLISLVNQKLCLGEELVGFGKPVALALVGSLRAGPDLFQALVVPCPVSRARTGTDSPRAGTGTTSQAPGLPRYAADKPTKRLK
ncbi:MAG: hypothetical protein NTW99_01235, partial [Chloroflexi bacterium]|nr:hypothetical protein [Chloroflexota bacterium]